MGPFYSLLLWCYGNSCPLQHFKVVVDLIIFYRICPQFKKIDSASLGLVLTLLRQRTDSGIVIPCTSDNIKLLYVERLLQ